MPQEAARVSKEKKVRTKEKKARTGRKHESLKVWEYYEVKEGAISRKRKNCPRCGSGTFLAEHKERMYCGRCGYTEFEKKNRPAEGKPDEGAGAGGRESEKENNE
jgi:small subunit ribosomal protein S27Ae